MHSSSPGGEQVGWFRDFPGPRSVSEVFVLSLALQAYLLDRSVIFFGPSGTFSWPFRHIYLALQAHCLPFRHFGPSGIPFPIQVDLALKAFHPFGVIGPSGTS